MTATVLVRLRDVFLDRERAATASRPATQVAERALPSTLGVLAAPADAAAAGAALGLVAAGVAGVPCALVCHWTGSAGQDGAPASASAPAVGPARRLAARLASRGLAAGARGRLVTVALPEAEAEARAAAERALAAAGDTPTVLVLSGPRSEGFDALLAELDRLVVVPPPGAPPGLEHLALDAAARVGRATGVLRLPPAGAPARRIALSCGLPLSPGLRAAAHDALGGQAQRAVREERGQAMLLLLGVLLAVLVGAGLLGSLAQGLGTHQQQRGAADLAALAGAEAMRAAQPRLFEPVELDDGVPNPRHLERAEYLALGRAAALATARRNGAQHVDVAFPEPEAVAPNRIAVTVRDPIRIAGRDVVEDARALAEVAPVMLPSASGDLSGEYAGPLATRQGKRMRPDVALAFDRMSAAAADSGVTLIINSAFRSNAEQAALFAAHPDPKWVARPGTSLHRLGTELDLGPAAAYGWLAAHAPGFGFKMRYNWEPWHFGYTRAAGSRSVGFGPGDGRSGLPSFVPAQWAPAIGRAAQRWNVGAALLAAQLYKESHFNPFARSTAGALGLAQFMPGTAKGYHLSDPFDGEASIMAQAHLMHDLLAQFGSVPLALAAYNAGPRPVAQCGCIPPYPETVAYVAEILGLLGGAGDSAAAGTGLQVRLVA